MRHVSSTSTGLLAGLILFILQMTHAAWAAPENTPHWEKDKPYSITVLHTNDHHGRFWQNDIGEYGLSAQKTLVDQIRKEVSTNGGELLILSGGDVNTGVPESDILHAEPDFKAMNKIGYDAMAVGNHEFDHELPVIWQQQKWAGFPFLSANIYFRDSGKRVFSPYKIFNRQGVKIAVFGLTTDDTDILASPNNTKGIEFRPTLPEAQRVIAEIKQNENPDIIIAVTHMGHYSDGNHGSMAPGDVTLARGLPTGDLDMIVGGHSQNPVCMESKNERIDDYVPATPCVPDQQNGTWIVQAHEWGKYIGRADFTFFNGKLTLKNYQLIPINLKKEVDNGDGTKHLAFYTHQIEQDPAMLAFLTPYQQKAEQQLLTVIGRLNGRFEGDRSKTRYQQTNLGQMLLSALIERTKADVGVMTGGMIRDSMIEGNISYRDILKVEPFGNQVVYADLTGSELINYLQVAINKKIGSGGYGHFRNVSITVDDDNTITEVKVKNKPLKRDETYRLVTLDFLAAGGDGYPILKTLPTYVDTGYLDAEVVKHYFQIHSPINASEYDPEGVIIKKQDD